MFSIEKLSEITGLSRRGIRYYVQAGLIPPPEGKGRGSVYTQQHADLILKIKNWSEQGYPLFRIKDMLNGTVPPEPITVIPSLSVAECELASFGDGISLLFPKGKLSLSQLAQIQQSVLSITKGGSDGR